MRDLKILLRRKVHVHHLPLLDIIRVGKVNCGVNSNDQDSRNLGGLGILLEVPIHICSRNLPECRGSGSSYLQQNLTERYRHLPYDMALKLA